MRSLLIPAFFSLALACGGASPGGNLPFGDGGVHGDGDGGTSVAVQGLNAVAADGTKIGVVLGIGQNGVIELWHEELRALLYVQAATGFVTQPNPVVYGTATCGGSVFMAAGFDGNASGYISNCEGVLEFATNGVAVITAVGGSSAGGVLGSDVRITGNRFENTSMFAWRPASRDQRASNAPMYRQSGQCAAFDQALDFCGRELFATSLPTKFVTPITFGRE